MPYRRKTRKPAKRKRGRVYKRGIPKKALYGAVDTALEKRMQSIAKKEVESQIVHLVQRKYLFGSQSRVTNKWHDGRRIFFDGAVDEICQIPKADIDQVLNAPLGNDPEEAPQRQMVDDDGANQGMTVKTSHGKRIGDIVKVTGFSVDLKVFQDRIPNEFQHDSMYAQNNSPNYEGQNAWHQWFLRNANGAFDKQLMETVVLKWALVQVSDETAKLMQGQVPEKEYTAENFIPIRPFGYSAALDHTEKDKTQFLKKKTIMKGECTLTLRPDTNKEKTIKQYIKLKRPIKLEYEPADQRGDQSLAKRYFFAVRTNVPIKNETVPEGNEDYNDVDYSPFAPKIMACIKTFYHE